VKRGEVQKEGEEEEEEFTPVFSLPVIPYFM